MIASLMMYARPEVADATARYWVLIREALSDRGIAAPETLSNDAEVFSVWEAPDLVLSQTCGMPFRQRLHPHVALVGTPDYGLDGCAAGYYRSAIVVRRSDDRDDLADFADARFAFNNRDSQSGYAAPHALAKSRGFWFKDRHAVGGHVHAARAVAENRADIAAIDAVTWELIQRHDAFAADLRVLDWTAPTPGLPYITSPTQDAEAIFAAVAEAIENLSDADRNALMLKGILRIPKADYLAIPNPPDGE